MGLEKEIGKNKIEGRVEQSNVASSLPYNLTDIEAAQRELAPKSELINEPERERSAKRLSSLSEIVRVAQQDCIIILGRPNTISRDMNYADKVSKIS